MSKRILAACALAASLVALAGCKDDKQPAAPATEVTASPAPTDTWIAVPVDTDTACPPAKQARGTCDGGRPTNPKAQKE